jgi:hypothetical protein
VYEAAMATELPRLTELAASLNLEGSAAADFITQQQNVSREERSAERELNKLRLESERIKSESEKAKSESERASALAAVEIEKAKINEKIRLAELQAETERVRLQHEAETERVKLQHELELAKLASSKEESDSARAHASVMAQNGVVPTMNSAPNVVKPKLPVSIEGQIVTDFLVAFERAAQLLKISKEQWPAYLIGQLTERGTRLFNTLDEDETSEYDTLKVHILKAYDVTPDSHRQKFRSAKLESGETTSQYITKLRRLMIFWVKSKQVNEAYEDVLDFFYLGSSYV